MKPITGTSPLFMTHARPTWPLNPFVRRRSRRIGSQKAFLISWGSFSPSGELLFVKVKVMFLSHCWVEWCYRPPCWTHAQPGAPRLRRWAQLCQSICGLLRISASHEFFKHAVKKRLVMGFYEQSGGCMYVCTHEGINRAVAAGGGG